MFYGVDLGSRLLLGTARYPSPKVLAEAIADVTFRLAPIERVDAEEMIDELRAQALLGPLRGEPPVDRERLAGVLLASHGKYVNPNVLHWTQSGTLMVMVILGGVGRLWGGAVGAATLLGLEDPNAQVQLAHRIVAEGLSVRAVEEIVALGGDSAKPRRKQSRQRPVAPGLADLADRLSDVLDTRVKVELGQRKGKIVVEFASLDDLDRIVKAISPG